MNDLGRRPASAETDEDNESGLTDFERHANEAIDRARRDLAPMPSVRQIMERTVRERHLKASENQRALMVDFFEVVQAWRDGDLTLGQVRTLTGDAFLRAMVISITPMSHPLYGDAMRMLDLLIASEPAHEPRYFTKHGWFTKSDIEAAGGRVIDVAVDGDTGEIRQKIQFPLGFDHNGNKIWPSNGRATDTPAQQRERFRSPFADRWYADDELVAAGG